MLVLVLENPDRFAIRLTEQTSCRTSVSWRSRNPQCTEDEHDDDSKFQATSSRTSAGFLNELGFIPLPPRPVVLIDIDRATQPIYRVR